MLFRSRDIAVIDTLHIGIENTGCQAGIPFFIGQPIKESRIDGVDDRGVQREATLHTGAEADLTNNEGFTDAITPVKLITAAVINTDARHIVILVLPGFIPRLVASSSSPDAITFSFK